MIAYQLVTTVNIKFLNYEEIITSFFVNEEVLFSLKTDKFLHFVIYTIDS